MVRCPVCEATELILVLGDGSGACMRCGCTWHQEGAAQREVRPNPTDELVMVGPRISSLELGIDLVKRLVDDHQAVVLEYDVTDRGGTIHLQVPAPTIHERLAMLIQTHVRTRTQSEDLARKTQSLRQTLAQGRVENDRLRARVRLGMIRYRGLHTLARAADMKLERRLAAVG